jgi:hypothetical protein
MSTEPDKDVELLALFVKGAMALHPNLDPDGDALEALASLESQNQALQEALKEIRDLKPALGETRTRQAAALWRSLAFVDMKTIARNALSLPRRLTPNER